MTIESSSERVEIRFSDDEGRQEYLPARPLDEGLYKLEESPAYAYSVSAGDLFTAESDSEGKLKFSGVVKKSGNRTIRILFARFGIDSKEAKPILERLTHLGCQYKTSGTFLLSVLLPPEASLEDVVDYLSNLGLWWEHADPTWDELHKDDTFV